MHKFSHVVCEGEAEAQSLHICINVCDFCMISIALDNVIVIANDCVMCIPLKVSFSLTRLR